MMAKDTIGRAMRDHQESFEQTFQGQAETLSRFACQVAEIFQRGGKLLLAGNGPLGAVANLNATLFSHRLTLERPPLPAVSLCHDVTLATALSSAGQSRDFFSRQLRVVAREGDGVLLLSDGRRDETLAEAATAARQIGCLTAALNRGDTGLTAEGFDFFFSLTGESTARAAEHALFFAHLLVELVEGELFGI